MAGGADPHQATVGQQLVQPLEDGGLQVQIRVAADLGRRYGAASVPTVIVNGKYRVPNTRNVLEVIDELLVREGMR